ncbi:MAG: EAL domain-containing protein [Gammaproteobacteria bacterium]|nr:EAL domain-containing protein [Gammaproteobacteria bacterium]
MTLSRQLVLLLLVLLLMVITGTFLISARNSQLYLEEQLASHAQDAATSLGLSLSQSLADNDRATIESMTDAMFDRGFYRQIRIEDNDGGVILERKLEVTIEGVPDWFVNYLALETPEGDAAVMAGWRQTGVVRVSSHPGYAYAQLWRNISDMFRWFLLSALLVSLLGVILLRWLLQPLRDIEWQADAICQRDFPVLEPLPKTRDLRLIVEAMNRLSSRVKLMLRESEQLAAGLRRQAYQHPVTGLSNRRHFKNTLANLIDSPEEFASGILALIQLQEFKKYNDSNGFAAGDELLRDIAKVLGECTKGIPHHVLAHLGGANFALLAQDYTQQQGSALGAKLTAALSQLGGMDDSQAPGPVHVGLAHFNGVDSPMALLARADMALQAARSAGPGGWHLMNAKGASAVPVKTASEWRVFIEQCLAMDRLRLYTQPVLSCPQRNLLHEEVLVRLLDTTASGAEVVLTAGIFMPQAERAGLTAEIDRAVVSQVLARLSNEVGRRYAVNLSPHSLRTPGFLDWLEHQLRIHQSVAGNLIFEMAEFGAVSIMDEVHCLIQLLERNRCQFSLDHFGRGFSSFGHLQSLKADYLKVDGSYMRSLGKNRDNQFFLHSLTKIAHGLGIQVIAESIESEAQWDLLSTMNIDGAQGYFIGRPG